MKMTTLAFAAASSSRSTCTTAPTVRMAWSDRVAAAGISSRAPPSTSSWWSHPARSRT